MRVEAHAADLGGCGHYRLIWAAEALMAGGYDLDLVLPDTGKANIDCIVSLEATAAAGAPVLGGLRHPPSCDVLVLQRPMTAHLVDVIRFHRAAGVAVVVEVDDHFEAIDPANVAWPTVQPRLNPHRNFHHLREACRIADLVVVSTPALAAHYGRHGRVVVIENHIPRAYLHALPDQHDDLRLGWSGSVDTHPRDLQVTRGAVARVLRRHDLTFHLIGAGRVHFTDPDTGLDVETTDPRIVKNLSFYDGQRFAHTNGWLPLGAYSRAMAELDIGIVPLALSAFNEAKSWLKGLEWAALGVPFVASPTGQYRDLVAQGAGRIAGRPRDWERELDLLITNDDYRGELAQAGRRVAGRWIIEDHADRWWNAWQTAAENYATRKVPA